MVGSWNRFLSLPPLLFRECTDWAGSLKPFHQVDGPVGSDHRGADHAALQLRQPSYLVAGDVDRVEIAALVVLVGDVENAFAVGGEGAEGGWPVASSPVTRRC